MFLRDGRDAICFIIAITNEIRTLPRAFHFTLLGGDVSCLPSTPTKSPAVPRFHCTRRNWYYSKLKMMAKVLSLLVVRLRELSTRKHA